MTGKEETISLNIKDKLFFIDVNDEKSRLLAMEFELQRR